MSNTGMVEEKPAKVFLNELSDKQRAKTIRDLKILELYGNRLREPQSKYLEDGLLIYYPFFLNPLRASPGISPG